MNSVDRVEIEAVLDEPDTTVGDVATRIPAAKPAMERLGIDCCCGGSRKLLAELKEKSITVEQRVEAIQQTAPARRGHAGRDWSTASLTELADHVLGTHHVFMKRELPRIAGLLAKVTAAHAERHGRMLGELTAAFLGLRDEIEQHLLTITNPRLPYSPSCSKVSAVVVAP